MSRRVEVRVSALLALLLVAEAARAPLSEATGAPGEVISLEKAADKYYACMGWQKEEFGSWLNKAVSLTAQGLGLSFTFLCQGARQAWSVASGGH